VGALALNAGEDKLYTAVIDPAGGFAYFGTDNSPGIVVKVRLADFTRVGALTLNTGENKLWSAVIDPAGGFAYFGTYTSPGRVVKVRLPDLTRMDALTLNAGEDWLPSAVIDPAAGYAYFGTDISPNPGIVVKVRIRPLPDLAMAKSVAPDTDAPYHGVVTYTVILSNTGAVNDTNVLFTDTLPAQVDFAQWVQNPGATV
jgi:uncharacterized repeat protein (TIGR01451 family)